MAKQLTPEEQSLFKQYMTTLKYPAAPSGDQGDSANSTTSVADYKSYPTSKNVPASLKGGADNREKSTGQIAGYTGDVLKNDPTVREGKGM